MKIAIKGMIEEMIRELGRLEKINPHSTREINESGQSVTNVPIFILYQLTLLFTLKSNTTISKYKSVATMVSKVTLKLVTKTT